MNMPEVNGYGAAGYRFTWPAEKIEIILDNFRENSRDGMKAEVTVISSRVAKNQVLVIDDVNLKSSRSRNDLALQLKKFESDIEWLSLLQYACITAIMRHREGEPCLL